MIDHPAITHGSDYTTIILAWFDGGLHWFDTPRNHLDMVVILDAYYLSYALGISLAWIFAQRWQKQGKFKVHSWQVYDLTLISILGVLLGAKTVYVLFYHLDYYIEHPEQIITNWSGMASHGAILGLIAGYWLWSRATKVSLLHIVDNTCIPAAMGGMFIRAANFLNGELYGRSCDPDLPWAMRFPMRDEVGQWLYADASNKVYSVVIDQPDGKITQHLEPYTLNEGWMRLTERNPVKIEGQMNVWPVVTDARHPSQIYQLILTGIVLTTVLFMIRKRSTRVGTVTGAFFVGYGITRIIEELFRQPDQQLGFVTRYLSDAFGIEMPNLSMGQLLSLGLIAAGLLILRYRAKHPRLIAELPMPIDPRVQKKG
ncbi:MAG: prolipoprotein diacylglyceryl transferase [Planctomycetaceae bacterium]|nr:prolipoprotein diacylglyceryl transferase [Planctomycetaceae bacterium]